VRGRILASKTSTRNEEADMTRFTNRPSLLRALLITAAFGAVLGVPHSVGAVSRPNAPAPLAPVSFEFKAGKLGPTMSSGMWYGSGAIDDSGPFVTTRLNLTSSAHFPTVGGFQSELVLTGCKGTLVVREELRFTREGMKGVWQIVDGTGSYDRLKGHGKLHFLPLGRYVLSGVVSGAA
jgi:hypothetical protein